MAPEALALGLIVAVLAVCYGLLYPRLTPLTQIRLMKADALVTLGLLVVIGMLVDGRATRFSLLLFETNWIVFTLVVMLALEMPLYTWFMRRNGLDPWDFGDGDEG